MGYRTVALIPAYEPDDILLDVLAQLKAVGMEIVIVDDGSGPKYAEIFEKAAVWAELITCIRNRGKGAALKTGMKHIQETYGQDLVIVTVDADGQHRGEDAARLSCLAAQHPDTLYLGSRKLKENVPLRSRFGNTVTRLVYQVSTGLKVYDTQTGLRAFHVGLLPELLSISGERYEYEMNVLLEFAHKRIPVREMEIETIYIDNNSSSHFDSLRDSMRIYKEILKYSASSFMAFLVDYVMYSLLLYAGAGLYFANIGARIISAAMNYTLNRKFVFKSRCSIWKSASRYFLLAVFILFCNTLVLGYLADVCGINRMAAKVFTEVLFFLLSWIIQKRVIFRKKGE